MTEKAVFEDDFKKAVFADEFPKLVFADEFKKLIWDIILPSGGIGWMRIESTNIVG